MILESMLLLYTKYTPLIILVMPKYYRCCRILMRKFKVSSHRSEKSHSRVNFNRLFCYYVATCVCEDCIIIVFMFILTKYFHILYKLPMISISNSSSFCSIGQISMCISKFFFCNTKSIIYFICLNTSNFLSF